MRDHLDYQLDKLGKAGVSVRLFNNTWDGTPYYKVKRSIAHDVTAQTFPNVEAAIRYGNLLVKP